MNIKYSAIYDRLMSLTNIESSFNISLSIVSLGKELRGSAYIGDSVRIKFSSSKDCYLTLIDIGAGGTASIIVPSKFDLDNFIRAGRDVYIPEGDDGVAAVIHGPVGLERLKAFATLKPLNLFSVDFSNLNSDSFYLSEDRCKDRIERAFGILENEPAYAWAEASLSFSIRVNEGFADVR